MKKYLFFFLISLLFILMPVGVWSACVESPAHTWTCDPSYASLSALMANSNLDPGDTVNVTIGSVSWGSTLTITKGINLIASSVTVTCSAANTMIVYNPSNQALNTQMRISGFTFDVANTCQAIKLGPESGSYLPTTLQTNLRIDHNIFKGNVTYNVSNEYIWNKGMGGVIDNNTFTGPSQNMRSMTGDGTDYWYANYTNVLGDSRALHFEDNTFNVGEGGQFGDCQDSGWRKVFRYNNITVSESQDSGLIDIHGESSGIHSCYGDELYGNNLTSSVNGTVRWADARGGTSLVFFNNATTSGSVSPNKIMFYLCASTYALERNVHDTYQFGNRKNLTVGISDWDLSIDTGNSRNCAPNGDNYPLVNRDYFDFKSSFNGTIGVGCGTLGNRPATCTTGVGYWVTDQSCSNLTGMVGVNPSSKIIGALHKCTATNTWTSYYTPYTYPHPLRGEGIIPSSVQGLTIQGGTLK